MRWELWRQDDHGNEFLMCAFDDPARAAQARDEYIARGHHQHYWVRVAPDAERGGADDNAPVD
jgi:hypothetical protein